MKDKFGLHCSFHKAPAAFIYWFILQGLNACMYVWCNWLLTTIMSDNGRDSAQRRLFSRLGHVELISFWCIVICSAVLYPFHVDPLKCGSTWDGCQINEVCVHIGSIYIWYHAAPLTFIPNAVEYPPNDLDPPVYAYWLIHFTVLLRLTSPNHWKCAHSDRHRLDICTYYELPSNNASSPCGLCRWCQLWVGTDPFVAFEAMLSWRLNISRIYLLHIIANNL